MSPDPNALPDWPGKLEARGKFFFSGTDKVLLKGVTYGPFAPDAQGTQFPDWDTIARDLDLITELEYDFILNPIRAEVDIELTVNAVDSCSDDVLAKGALEYTTIAKEAQALANLANTAEQIVELIPL